jgi:hypothetical protein
MPSIAVFVSAHGFGHAARVCAVLQAMAEQRPGLRYEIFTAIPGWFFEQSLTAEFEVHSEEVDVGLVQRTALDEDLEATVRRLDTFYDSASRRIDRLAAGVRDLGCDVVVNDIAPIGLAVAEQLNVPGVLVENFTWDWIYQGYQAIQPGLASYGLRLSRLFSKASLHLQCEPVCRVVEGAVSVAPVSRYPRLSADVVRRRLGVAADNPLVLLTMGGIRWDFDSLDRLRRATDISFVIPGAAERESRDGNIVRLPFKSSFYHPDLVRASDVVVGKLGYSTVAETYHAGARLFFVARPQFRESAILEKFARDVMAAEEIPEGDFVSGDWLEALAGGIPHQIPTDQRPNGADHAAELILDLLHQG